jgi:hypothetical protein
MKKGFLVLGSITALLAFIVLIVIGYLLKWGWTGFPTKTLWDWLSVLAIPAAVGFGTIWITTKQAQESETENIDNQRESALQAYLDKMSDLLLEKKLRESKQDEEVRNIARVRTLTVLRQLDSFRKASVLQFLCESGLIDKDNQIVDLSGADLQNADLRHIFLGREVWDEDAEDPRAIEVDLSETNLRGANLSGTNLTSVCLFNANLSQADLRWVFLGEDNLIGVNLSGANLYKAIPPFKVNIKSREPFDPFDQVKSLKGAIMPDGSKHS